MVKYVYLYVYIHVYIYIYLNNHTHTSYGTNTHEQSYLMILRMLGLCLVYDICDFEVENVLPIRCHAGII